MLLKLSVCFGLFFSLNLFAAEETCEGLVKMIDPSERKPIMARAKALVDPDARTIKLQIKSLDTAEMFTFAEGELAESKIRFNFINEFSLGDLETLELNVTLSQDRETRERFLSLASTADQRDLFVGLYDCTLPKDKKKSEKKTEDTSENQQNGNSNRDRDY